MNVKEHIEELIKKSDSVDEIMTLANAYQMIINAQSQERMTTCQVHGEFDESDDIVS